MFIKNYSLLVLFICCIVAGFIIILKSLLLSLIPYVVLLIYMSGILLMLFYFSLTLEPITGPLNKPFKLLSGLLIIWIILWKGSLGSLNTSQHVIQYKNQTWSFIWLLCFVVLYFMSVLNYYHKMKFLRQLT